MPARTGEEYRDGLRNRGVEVFIRGERVKDVTTHPAFRNGVDTLAALYDMQHEVGEQADMTYISPSTGERVGTSFLKPETVEDLEKRRKMMSSWARRTNGMMGRTPDYMNVSFMAMAAAQGYFEQNRSEFGANIRRYYEYIRERDLVLTHTLLNFQRSRLSQATPLEDSTDTALTVIEERTDGVVVHGARILATLGPLADEIAVYPTRSHSLPGSAPDQTVFAFSIPCETHGLKFLCRESFDLGNSHFDHPLGSRFEEMDAVVIFDHVLVPWERVFLLGDVELANNLQVATNRHLHTGHQVVTKNVAKCEFLLGLVSLMTDALGSSKLPHINQMVAEVIENLEITKACLRAAEVDARIDQWGVMSPAHFPLRVAQNQFIRMYPRMIEILQLVGSSSLMALPTEADMSGPLSSDIRRYLETNSVSAQDRVRIFRLAWDTACSSFGSRQVLYERFFQGDFVRNAAILCELYDREPAMERVREFLKKD